MTVSYLGRSNSRAMGQPFERHEPADAPPKLLVVDDNPTNLSVLFEILERAGYRVLIASSGEDALRKASLVRPDLVLMDVMMPGLDGFETCRRLKQAAETARIPVIFLTAATDEASKLEGFRAGGVDYAIKPIVSDRELLARVQLHLRLRQLSDRLEEQNQRLQAEVTARQEAELRLVDANAALEKRVAERTRALCDRTVELDRTLAELQKAQVRLQHDALHDRLTGLPNRAWLNGQLERAIARALGPTKSADGNPLGGDLADGNLTDGDPADDDPTGDNTARGFGLLFVDLDRFKPINDTFGHLFGDRLLVRVGERLQASLPPEGNVARFGGDEFVILLAGMDDLEAVLAAAETLRSRLEQPFQVDDRDLFVSASIGATTSRFGYAAPEAALRDANLAMYCAKHAGRAQAVAFDPSMQVRAAERLSLETELRQAISRGDFTLHYQPIVALETGAIAGFEALLRWVSPTRGPVSPAEFVPLAEESGAIGALGDWVLDAACRQIHRWRSLDPEARLPVTNVNLSPLQLQQPDLVERVRQILDRYGISPSALKFELVETRMFEAFETCRAAFNDLRSLGLKLCVDDFGTGYSSLERLHELPIDTLKIDRSFVSRLTDHRSSASVIRAIVDLGRALDMEVVAEGIETREQCQRLRALGCELGQGYWFARPVTAEVATQLWRSRSRLPVADPAAPAPPNG